MLQATRGRVTARVRVGRNPLGSALVGGTLWVACIDGNEIAAIDLETARVRRRIVEPGGPIAIAAAPRASSRPGATDLAASTINSHA